MLMLTSNLAAAAWHDIPPSTALTKRFLMSFDNGAGIHADLLSVSMFHHLPPLLEITCRFYSVGKCSRRCTQERVCPARFAAKTTDKPPRPGTLNQLPTLRHRRRTVPSLR